MVREQTAAYINNAILYILFGLALLLPVLTLPFSTDIFEMPKLILLIFSVLLLLILWSAKWVVTGRVSFSRTPLDIPVLIFTLIVVLSTIFNGESRFISIMGNFPKVADSAVAWVAYALFYFVLVSNIKTISQVRTVLYLILISLTFSTIIALMSYFRLFLPFDWARNITFNPTGSPFALASLLALILPLIISSIVVPNKLMPRWIAIIFTSVFVLAIFLIGSITSVTLLILGTLLTLFLQRKYISLKRASSATRGQAPATIIENFVFDNGQGEKKSALKHSKDAVFESITKFLPWTVVVVPLLVVAVIVLSFIPLGKFNPLQTFRAEYPQEIQQGFSSSWQVANYSFTHAPFFGTGPATYLYNFTRFKPESHNYTAYWGANFDTSYNEFLQTLATLGGLGLIAFIFLTFTVLRTAIKGILKAQENTTALGLSVVVLMVIVYLLIHSINVATMSVILLLLASFMAVSRHLMINKVEDLTFGVKATRGSDNGVGSVDPLPIIIFIPLLMLVIYAGWNASTAVIADYYHREGLQATTRNAVETYQYFVQAETYNPYIDLYRVDLAQTNFALANAVASVKLSQNATPGATLTDEDKENIQLLLSQSISEAQNAIKLAPASSRNWEVLASIYRQITGVAQNALLFALDSYGRAIQNDPLNPVLRVNVGGVYFSIKNYDQAIRFYQDAVNLKSDYPNAYYNLAVAFKEKGDLGGAQAAIEAVIRLVDPKSQDYQTATSFLNDLKNQNATGSADKSDSALQNQNLPDVLDLPKPESIATPAAIRPTPSPSPSPSPKASVSPSPSASVSPSPSASPAL